MLRFFSRRKPRGRADQKGYYQHQQQLEREKALRENGGGKRKPNKNVLPCRIILLDGADLSIDISVSLLFIQEKFLLLFVWLYLTFNSFTYDSHIWDFFTSKLKGSQKQ